MKSFLKWFAPSLGLLVFFPPVQASQTVVGEYDGAFHGYLTVKPTRLPNRFKVWLGVGAGSCGGDVLIKDAILEIRNGRTSAVYRPDAKSCVARIVFSENGAEVSESCIKPESEANSTCAMMGHYEKRSHN